MKTRHPLILTAHLDDADLEPFDRLRRQHFPSDRNFLRAHLTMFHRLPGEHIGHVREILHATAGEAGPIHADVDGLRHLGAGVAFTVRSPLLTDLRDRLRTGFLPWLNTQDMQPWQPHITVQNKVARGDADRLHDQLVQTFEPRAIRITGIDLWAYLGGPWRLETSLAFGTEAPRT